MVQDLSWVTPPSYCKYSRIVCLDLQKSTVEVCFEKVYCTYRVLVSENRRGIAERIEVVGLRPRSGLVEDPAEPIVPAPGEPQRVLLPRCGRLDDRGVAAVPQHHTAAHDYAAASLGGEDAKAAAALTVFRIRALQVVAGLQVTSVGSDSVLCARAPSRV